MKNWLVIPLMMALIISLVFAGCTYPTSKTTTGSEPTQGNEEEIFEIALNIPINPTHFRWLNLVKPWVTEVEQRTNGRVSITPYFAGSLAGYQANIEAVKSGICDIAEGAINEYLRIPGSFTLTQLTGLPVWPPDAELCSKALWNTLQTNSAMRKEWEGVKVLSLASWMPVHLNLNRPIHNTEAWQGNKINAFGNLKTELTKAFGGIPTTIGIADSHMALEKGIIDGYIASPEPLWSRQWGETLKYSADYSFGANPFYMVMNQKVWNKLPIDVQQIIDQLSGETLSLQYGRMANSNHDMDLERLIENLEHEHYNLPTEETARWFDICKLVSKDYLDSLEAKGMPAYDIFNFMMEYMPKKYSLD